MSTKHNYFPKWLQEFKRFQSLKSQFFIYGNVYDSYYFPDNYKQVTIKDELYYTKYNDIQTLMQEYLSIEGFEVVIYFDVVDGLMIDPSKSKVKENNLINELNLSKKASNYIEGANSQKPYEKKLDDAINLFREIVNNTEKLSACIVNFASLFTSNPNSLENEIKPVFLKMLKAAQESRKFNIKSGQRNLLIFICDKLSDIPVWLLLENPLTKGIEIQKPNREERLRFLNTWHHKFHPEVNKNDTRSEMENICKVFPDITENFTNHELENLITISNQEELKIQDIKEIVDLFKYGIKDNPWSKIENSVIQEAKEKLRNTVIGQDEAIKKSIEIIQRSKLGLDAIDKEKPSNKPKGILFFAGPTGTGKTYLAKNLAELIFNDEDAMIRFDMSEYNNSNSDVKLIGSPPGYVGYDDGGQLTDAIRNKPFSIILFDEIEKAHPKIFDKFLQILDDGRLTDGKGETVYFSQALIIFTSNLGIYKEDEYGNKIPNVDFNDDYEVIVKKIKTEIKAFFTNKLGRPEILNRFGDNFVVFDFIKNAVAKQILEKNLSTITKNLKKQFDIELKYDDKFINDFLDKCVSDNLDMGGRGIINRLETHIKNGLANFIPENEEKKNISLSIKGESVEFS